MSAPRLRQGRAFCALRLRPYQTANEERSCKMGSTLLDVEMPLTL
jgi:hypothetical protein